MRTRRIPKHVATAGLLASALLWAAAAAADTQVDYVIQISVDGLAANLLLTRIDTPGYENLKRLRDEGASTFDARTDYTQTWTNPNHASMLNGRPAEQPALQANTVHHGFLDNGEPDPSWTYHGPPPCGSPSHCNPNVSYIHSTFDVAHDNGRVTALYPSKSKFVIIEWSYDADSGAPDTTGPDDGTDKIDFYVNKESGSPLNGSAMHADFLADMAANHFNYTFLHYRDPDSAGHNSGWGNAEWDAAVQDVDDYLGDIFNLIAADPVLNGHTTIILTADHGGQGSNHADPSVPSIYTIPVFVWGPGVEAGADLYALNPTSRQDPGAPIAPGGAPQPRPDYDAPGQPIRDGGMGNLALSLLGLPPIPGSTINSAQDLHVGPTLAPFTAYNDCVHDGALSDTDPQGTAVHYKHPNTTIYGIGTICSDCGSSGAGTPYPFTSGRLIDVNSGEPTPVTATFTQNTGVSSVNWQSQVGPSGSPVAGTWSGGYDTQVGTDAYDVFNGFADMTGTIYYGGSGWWVDLELSGLDPAKTYTFVTSASRAKASTDGAPGYDDRNTLYTLSGADSAVNNSSAGVVEAGGNPLTLVMNTGNNHAAGRVIRWEGIDPGADGSVTIRAESEGVVNQAYAFDVFMLQESVGACGDGTLDAGEDCDNGAANGTAGQCCSATCAFEPVTTECRVAAGACDVAETCTGAAAACPADALVPASTECRAAADVCDVAEVCDGVAPTCPADAFEPPTTECRPQAGQCDLAELCTGAGAACPVDGDAPDSTPCDDAVSCTSPDVCTGGVCTGTDACTGGQVCDPGQDLCVPPPGCGNGVLEAGEDCDNGASNGTPRQCCSATCSFEPASTECRAKTGLCDVADFCTGADADCPPDGYHPAGYVCRAVQGLCDIEDLCSGVQPTCPNVFEPAGTQCRASSAPCDAVDLCSGTASNCPNLNEPAGTECRPAADVCDVAELCDGVTTACPADAFAPATSECRPQADPCDVAELCTGSGVACPVDAFAPDSTPCDDAVSCTSPDVCTSGVCTGTDACTGGQVCDPGQDLCVGSGCGNGLIEVGEDCDNGIGGNGTGGQCCSATCTFEPAATPCRGKSGACDVADFCTGADADCVDGYEPAGVVCRSKLGLCDIEDLCSGLDPTCPDAFEPGTTLCRVKSGACDVEDYCPGDASNCPNGVRPPGHPCRPATATCEGDEVCDGVDQACPPLPNPPLDCSDGDLCTADGCDSLTGCFNTPVPGCVGAVWNGTLRRVEVNVGTGAYQAAVEDVTTFQGDYVYSDACNGSCTPVPSPPDGIDYVFADGLGSITGLDVTMDGVDSNVLIEDEHVVSTAEAALLTALGYAITGGTVIDTYTIGSQTTGGGLLWEVGFLYVSTDPFPDTSFAAAPPPDPDFVIFEIDEGAGTVYQAFGVINLPEPGASLLLGSGILGLLALAARRRRQGPRSGAAPGA
jgi:hypothetical protein